jgi:UDP-2-acetamido-2,6-beta-L-arabino-hexul-4-ose reductase
LSSSIQATFDNPYGISKRKAEEILTQYAKKYGECVHIYRLPNVFGKWCKPNYNSVVATFCYNISHGLDISISDKNKKLELVYIDDVVNEFVKFFALPGYCEDSVYCEIGQKYEIILGNLAESIYQLRDIRSSLVVPDMADDLTRCLHATYLSYLEKDRFSCHLDVKTDQRGCLAELIKSRHFGQIFVSKTHEGVVRGNHYHDSKIEKFCVIQGEAVIKFRHVLNGEVLSYTVSGQNIEVVDIPSGYTHSIENVGEGEMIVIFWANQIFDPGNPDTYHCEV